MVTQFRTLPLDADLNAAVEALLRTSQHDFPVVGPAGEVRGLLTRDDLLIALRKSGPDTPVREVMRVDVPTVHESMLFERATAIMQESNFPALPVLDNSGRLVGLFTRRKTSANLFHDGQGRSSLPAHAPPRGPRARNHRRSRSSHVLRFHRSHSAEFVLWASISFSSLEPSRSLFGLRPG